MPICVYGYQTSTAHCLTKSGRPPEKQLHLLSISTQEWALTICMLIAEWIQTSSIISVLYTTILCLESMLSDASCVVTNTLAPCNCSAHWVSYASLLLTLHVTPSVPASTLKTLSPVKCCSTSTSMLLCNDVICPHHVCFLSPMYFCRPSAAATMLQQALLSDQTPLLHSGGADGQTLHRGH